MPYAKLKADILTARELRDAALRKVLDSTHQAVLQLSLVIPGTNKQPVGSTALFEWGKAQLLAQLSGLQEVTSSSDILGPWALFCHNSPALEIKPLTLQIEESQPAGRLLDIDVYNNRGKALDRKQMRLQQRRCLLCQQSARDCILTRNHNAEQLRERIDELLAPFRT